MSIFSWESYVEALLGTKPTQIEAVETGRHNDVFRANLEHMPVVIRMPKEELHTYPAEVSALQFLAEHNFPVPHLVGYSVTPPIMIMHVLPGKTVSTSPGSSQQEQGYFEDAGRWLTKMHNLELPGFGVFGAALEGQETSWQRFWQKFTSGKLRYAEENNLLSTEQAEVLRVAQGHILNTPLEQGVLLHGDFGAYNFLVEDDHISGILDFSDAIIGDKHYDVARSLYYQVTDQQTAFRKGYTHALDEELLKSHVLVLAVVKAVYHHRRSSEKKMACSLQLFDELRTTGSFGNQDCVV